MAEINLDQLAPVDYIVVGFPADKADFSGAMADELKKLIDSDTVRVLDLPHDHEGRGRHRGGSRVRREHDETELGELRSLEADLSLVLALDDVEQIGADLGPGSAAAVLVGRTPRCPLRIGDSPFRRGARRQRSHSHSGADRRSRGGPRGGRGRSVTWGL